MSSERSRTGGFMVKAQGILTALLLALNQLQPGCEGQILASYFTTGSFPNNAYKDMSGNARHLSATPASGSNYAIFNGNPLYVNGFRNYAFGDLTVCLYTKRTSSANYQGLLGTGYHSQGGFEFRYGRENGGTRFFINVKSTTAFKGKNFDTAGSLPLNAWTHVCMAYSKSGGSFDLYKNGAKKYTVTGMGTGGILQVNRPLWVGSVGASEKFVGHMKEVHVVGQKLSDAEISQVYANGGVVTLSPTPPPTPPPIPFFVRSIGPCTPGTVQTLTHGNSFGVRAAQDGHSGSSIVYEPHGLFIDDRQTLYIASAYSIRKMDLASLQTTTMAGTANKQGLRDGSPARALFMGPRDVAMDLMTRNLYIADYQNRIRVIEESLGGAVSTFAGDGTAANRDGPMSSAQFHLPTKIAVWKGKIFVSTTGGSGAVREIDTFSQQVRTVMAENGAGLLPAQEHLYVLVRTSAAGALRKWKYDTGAATVLGGKASTSDAQTDGPLATAVFKNANSLEYYHFHFVIGTDGGNSIHTYNPGTGVVQRLAGTNTAQGLRDGLASSALFTNPRYISIDHNTGHAYIADRSAGIRRICNAVSLKDNPCARNACNASSGVVDCVQGHPISQQGICNLETKFSWKEI
eukprot:jgi/Bigna1/81349/fgenesh1_pg.79_\